MYVGFPGSTQGTEIHSVEWWSFTSSLDSSISPNSSSSPWSLPPPTVVFMSPSSAKSPPPSLAPTGSNSASSTSYKESKSSSCHN
ncbi:hypothetical protein L484_021596 [Morus notabilis]|uniref:Uncharacterized protein n=1 Tax=Morus notabilis TaxID=981085 RepID=W9RXR4_9ROSA|nr:hypothetical protein L484_021596 [Morus notabilis]